MPELQQDGLDVSAEEERYLRRAFRRFAMPYLAGIAALMGLLAFAGPFAGTTGDSTSAELESMVAEAASLREAIAAVRTELQEQSGKTASRLVALERGVAGLSDQVAEAKARSAQTPAARGSAEIESRMDHAHQRLAALERRLDEVLESRLSAPAPAAPPAPAAVRPPAASSLP